MHETLYHLICTKPCTIEYARNPVQSNMQETLYHSVCTKPCTIQYARNPVPTNMHEILYHSICKKPCTIPYARNPTPFHMHETLYHPVCMKPCTIQHAQNPVPSNMHETLCYPICTRPRGSFLLTNALEGAINSSIQAKSMLKAKWNLLQKDNKDLYGKDFREQIAQRVTAHRQSKELLSSTIFKDAYGVTLPFRRSPPQNQHKLYGGVFYHSIKSSSAASIAATVKNRITGTNKNANVTRAVFFK